ncbi:MAG TPA: hypothetical protein VFP46_01425, partial [Candidatus Paceibacterota bacterium]|nr:hypothetical protein [Candidatus Paceibacterota bacterium]
MYFTRTNVYLGIVLIAFIYVFGFSSLVSTEYQSATAEIGARYFPLPKLDTVDYDLRLLALAHLSSTTPFASLSFAESATTAPSTTTPRLWPVRAIYPNAGALLPFKRIVAYYGNFYSRGMGVLGEYPENEMLAMLAS